MKKCTPQRLPADSSMAMRRNTLHLHRPVSHGTKNAAKITKKTDVETKIIALQYF